MFQRFATILYGPGRDAYVDIAAFDTSLRISPHIGGENSQGIGKMVTFCFDPACAVLAHRNGYGPISSSTTATSSMASTNAKSPKR